MELCHAALQNFMMASKRCQLEIGRLGGVDGLCGAGWNSYWGKGARGDGFWIRLSATSDRLEVAVFNMLSYAKDLARQYRLGKFDSVGPPEPVEAGFCRTRDHSSFQE